VVRKAGGTMSKEVGTTKGGEKYYTCSWNDLTPAEQWAETQARIKRFEQEQAERLQLGTAERIARLEQYQKEAQTKYRIWNHELGYEKYPVVKRKRFRNNFV
jgi:hypothetical protein